MHPSPDGSPHANYASATAHAALAHFVIKGVEQGPLVQIKPYVWI